MTQQMQQLISWAMLFYLTPHLVLLYLFFIFNVGSWHNKCSNYLGHVIINNSPFNLVMHLPMLSSRGGEAGPGVGIRHFFFFFSVKSPTVGMKNLIKSSKNSLPGDLFSGQISQGQRQSCIFLSQVRAFRMFWSKRLLQKSRRLWTDLNWMWHPSSHEHFKGLC